MTFKYKTGKIKHLRVNDLNNVWGGPGDELRTEVIVVLDSDGGRGAVGFDLHADDANLPARLAMLSVLRDAYIHDLPVALGYNIDEGKSNGYLVRIDLEH